MSRQRLEANKKRLGLRSNGLPAVQTVDAVSAPEDVLRGHAIVTYPQPFTTNPLVYVTQVTRVPQNVSLGVLRSTVTDPKLQQEIVLTRDGTTSTVINWLAIGKGAA